MKPYFDKVKITLIFACMKYRLFTLFTFTFVCHFLYAQVAIRGMVADYDNSDLIAGALVSIEGTSLSSETDIDGKYEISDVPEGEYTIVITAKNYQKKRLTNVKVGEFDMRLDITIELAPPVLVDNNNNNTDTTKVQTNEVIEVGKVIENGSIIVILQQKKATQIIENTNEDLILQTPAQHAGEVIANLPGVTLLENKYAIIRGLTDRYNTFALNGITLPNTEIERKGFEFSFIPANMIKDIVLYKSASADMSAEIAGGRIQLNTIDMPNQRKFIFSLGLNFNDLAFGNEFLTSEGNQLGKVQTLPLTFPSSYKIARSQGLYSNYVPVKGDREFLANTAKSLPNTWQANQTNAGLGQYAQILYQNKFKIRTRKLGISTAAELTNTYNINYIDRTDFLGIQNNQPVLDFTYQNKQFVRKGAINGMLNLAYEFNNYNKITLKNLVGILSESQVDVLTNGYQTASYTSGGALLDSAYRYKANFLRLIPRTLLGTQIGGEHVLPNFSVKGAKIDWRAGYTYFLRDEPDYRRVSYRLNNADGQYYVRIPQNLGNGYGDYAGFGASRVYIVGEDEVYSAELNASLPFTLFNAQSRVKTGVFTEYKYRFFDTRSIGYALSSNSIWTNTSPIFALPPHQVFDNANFSDSTMYVLEGTRPQDNYVANSNLNAGYAMFETTILKKWKTSIGMRVESFSQRLKVENYLKASNHKDLPVNTLIVDLLPSLNLIYNPNDKWNIRFAGSKTLSRPDPRELSYFSFLNATYTIFYAGNNNLTRTQIYNGDIRAEYYMKDNQVATFGVFYKYFINPIEQRVLPYTISAQYYRTYQVQNVANAQSTGVEANYTGAIPFVPNLQGYVNASYIISTVNVGARTRSLQGQSPYIINVGANYQIKKANLAFNANYQRFGKRIAIVGEVTPSLNYPDIYELGRDIIDLSIVKKLGKHFETRLDLRDVLNQPIRLVQIQDGKNYDASRDKLILKQQRGFNAFFAVKYQF